MTDVERFVVGIDGSEPARRALRWAIDEASTSHAQLDVVHAWDLVVVTAAQSEQSYRRDVEALEHEAAAVIDGEVAAATTGLALEPAPIKRLAVRDTPARALLNAATGADLLIVGGRGRGGFKSLLLGSVSNQCVHHAPCPVAVIRGDEDERGDQRRRRPILVGVDGSGCGNAALGWAIARATRDGAPVIALAAWSWLDQPGDFDPSYGAADVAEMAASSVEMGQREVGGGANVATDIRTVNDHAAHALIEASAEASLLVVGSRGLGGFRGLLLGSVSSQCLQHAHCPVVVVRESNESVTSDV